MVYISFTVINFSQCSTWARNLNGLLSKLIKQRKAVSHGESGLFSEFHRACPKPNWWLKVKLVDSKFGIFFAWVESENCRRTLVDTLFLSLCERFQRGELLCLRCLRWHSCKAGLRQGSEFTNLKWQVLLGGTRAVGSHSETGKEKQPGKPVLICRFHSGQRGFHLLGIFQSLGKLAARLFIYQLLCHHLRASPGTCWQESQAP